MPSQVFQYVGLHALDLCAIATGNQGELLGGCRHAQLRQDLLEVSNPLFGTL
jgi:hypothetical protein